MSAAVRSLFVCKYDNGTFNENITNFISGPNRCNWWVRDWSPIIGLLLVDDLCLLLSEAKVLCNLCTEE